MRRRLPAVRRNSHLQDRTLQQIQATKTRFATSRIWFRQTLWGIVVAVAACTPRQTSFEALTIEARENSEQPDPLPYWRDALTPAGSALALCAERRTGTGTLEVYNIGQMGPTYSSASFLRENCPRQVRKAERVGLLLFRFSCTPPWEPLARHAIAGMLGNQFLYPKATQVEVPVTEVTNTTALASVTGDALERSSWRLVDAWVRSAWLNGDWPSVAPAVFIPEDKTAKPFREFEAATRAGSRTFRGWSAGRWAAELTPSWQLTIKGPFSSKLVPRSGRKKSIQKLVLMGDLADHALVAAIIGRLEFDASLVLKDAFYTMVQGKVSVLAGASSVARNQKKQAFIRFKRLRVVEPRCHGRGLGAEDAMQRLRRVRHMRPATYNALQDLARRLRSGPEAELNLMARTGVSTETVRVLSERTITAAQLLKRACQNGSLKLDIDVDTYLQGDLELFKLARTCGP